MEDSESDIRIAELTEEVEKLRAYMRPSPGVVPTERSSVNAHIMLCINLLDNRITALERLAKRVTFLEEQGKILAEYTIATIARSGNADEKIAAEQLRQRMFGKYNA